MWPGWQQTGHVARLSQLLLLTHHGPSAKQCCEPGVRKVAWGSYQPYRPAGHRAGTADLNYCNAGTQRQHKCKHAL